MGRCRFRIAGAFLLATLLLSFAEAAWAATCDPNMAAMTGSSMAGMPGTDATPIDHECPPGHGHGRDGADDADPDCPFGPASGVGCTAPASLATVTIAVEAPHPVRFVRGDVADTIVHALRSHSIFHPPKT